MKHSGKLLILAIALVGSITVNAQVKKSKNSKNNGPYTYHVGSSIEAEWSSKAEDYIWGDWEDVDVDITVDGSTVTFNNKARTKLKIGEELEKEHYNSTYKDKTTLWSAVDQDDRRCKFRMMFYDDGDVGMIVYYNDIAIQFQQTESGMDNFRDN